MWDEKSQHLDELTTEVRKLCKKNKSLKHYIKSIVEAFAKKLKVKLPDCITSSSSSSSNGDEPQGAQGFGAKDGNEEEEDGTEREIELCQEEEELEEEI